MLFDLGTGKKKRFIQVIYGMLALLFLVGFVGFGIGGEIGSGGIADIFTGGSDDIEETQFSEDADEIEKQLETDPRNQELLVQLISLRFSAGGALIAVDEETGAQVLTEEAEQEYEQAVEAWDRYLALQPARPSASAALFAVRSLDTLARSAPNVTAQIANFQAAAEAQSVYAEVRPSVGQLKTLAFYSYAGLDFERGDAAAKKAAAAAPNANARRRVKKELEGLRQQAQAYQAQIRRQEQQQNQGDDSGTPDVPENPLGDVGSSGALTPAPAP